MNFAAFRVPHLYRGDANKLKSKRLVYSIFCIAYIILKSTKKPYIVKEKKLEVETHRNAAILVMRGVMKLSRMQVKAVEKIMQRDTSQSCIKHMLKN